jgi:uncharacterized membrane protein
VAAFYTWLFAIVLFASGGDGELTFGDVHV